MQTWKHLESLQVLELLRRKNLRKTRLLLQKRARVLQVKKAMVKIKNLSKNLNKTKKMQKCQARKRKRTHKRRRRERRNTQRVMQVTPRNRRNLL